MPLPPPRRNLSGAMAPTAKPPPRRVVQQDNPKAYGTLALCPLAKELAEGVVHDTIWSAIRHAAENGGNGCYESISFTFYKDEAELVKRFFKAKGKENITKLILCHIAEVK